MMGNVRPASWLAFTAAGGCFQPAQPKGPLRRVAILLALITLVPIPSLAQAQEMPPAYKQVLDALGKAGDFKDNVLKVNIPRNDLSITVANVKTPTPFGFGGWVALTKGTGGMDVMIGDLVLTPEEVNPVMSAFWTTDSTSRPCTTTSSGIAGGDRQWPRRRGSASRYW